MSFKQNEYSSYHLIGNTDVPTNLLASIRSNIRRANPDGGSSVPYYAGASGKFLSITYTKLVALVVTDVIADIELTDNSLAAIISAINLEDPTNLEALDQDGFLCVRNKNLGRTHRIEINPYSINLAIDAAPILGFEVTPFPGSISYVGELASTPPNRIQGNPQGTALVARDEDLKPETFNRSIVSLLAKVDLLKALLNKDVLVYKDVDLTFAAHPISGRCVAKINDNDIRIPILDISSNLENPSFFFRVMDEDGIISVSTDLEEIKVVEAYYATLLTALTPGVAFVSWGTPDGGSVWHSSIPGKTKQSSIAITSVSGNIIYCDGATFVTKKVKKGDPVLIDDTLRSPFDCSGWFAVEKVIDEEHIAIRTMSDLERAPGSQTRPARFNPNLTGNLEVYVGYYLPAGDVYLELSPTSNTDHRIRLACAVPLSDALTNDWGLISSGDVSSVGSALNDHITDAVNAHAATAINGFNSATTWRDGTGISGATLKATIEDILTDLRNNGAGTGGTGKIGAEAFTIAGDAPNSFVAGSLLAQLTDIVTQFRDLIYFNKNETWHDGTSLPTGSIQSTFDNVQSLLANDTLHDGAGLIGAKAAGGLSQGSVRSQLDELDTNWGKLSRANTWALLQTFTLGATALVNKDFTVSGTGRYKHGDFIKAIHPFSFIGDGNWSPSGALFFAANGYLASSLSGYCAIPVSMLVGQRIKSVTVSSTGNGVADVNVKVLKFDATGTLSNITAAPTTISNMATWTDTVVDVTDTTITDGDSIYISFELSATGIGIGTIRVTYDWP